MYYRRIRHWIKSSGIILGMILSIVSFQSCSDDILTGQPSWLGNSIYEELENEGNYTTTLKLIDDLGQKDVLSQTGSKTLFVADDDAFAKWFQTNSWGIHSYDKLSTAQKKILFNSSMINNAYLIELLSNVNGTPPEMGQCMRRSTAASIYDSVAVVYPSQMPGTVAWSRFKNAKRSIRIFKDATTAPMIHFLPAYMNYNKITDEDLSILTNGQATSTSEAWVNGEKVIDRDITCKNGYIQKVENVVQAAPNMAQILRDHPIMSGWSTLIDRFSAPYYNASGSKEFNRLYNSNDSVYTLRYYSDVSAGGNALNKDPDGNTVSATLAFDPGWNQYMYTNTMGKDLHYDCGAMIVPTNAALNEWWNNGGGKVLKDVYASWSAVPDLVISKLLNVNMLGTFSESVPSKFSSIMNDAKVELGINKSNVDSCFMGCNGVVYLVNKVFTPSAYASVSFPALIHQDVLSVIYWAIDNLEFTPYLNSMDSYYSLILPTNTAMLYYVDPCYFGETRQTMLEFYYDEDEKTVKANRYYCTIENGKVIPGDLIQKDIASNIVSNRLTDLMNQLIIVGNVEDGHTYYKSKGGTLIKVSNAGTAGSMNIAGGWQIENGSDLTVNKIYDESKNGNGKSYEINDQMPIGAEKSVYEILKNNSEFSEFYNLLNGGDPDSASQNMLINTSGKYTCVNSKNNYNMRLFDTYNYTVYVPTNASIKALENDGYLPTWDDFDKEYEIANDESNSNQVRTEAKAACQVIKKRIEAFVRYHIQDNSVLIGGAPETDANGNEITSNNYESMMVNPSNGRFYPLGVSWSNSAMTVKDVIGNVRHVIKNPGTYNQICREYWFSGSGASRTIYTTSDAVIQQIDGPLYYSSTEKTTWKSLVRKISRSRRI